MADELDVHTNSVAIRVSREMAVAHGLVEPTYEERMATYEWAVKHRAEKAEARRLFAQAKEAIAALDPEQTPIACKVLALHAPNTDRGLPPTCDGCPEDYEQGPHAWPCETVALVCAEPYIAIELPEASLIEDDYEPVHPDDQPPWKPATVRSLFPQAFVKGTFIDYFDGGKEGSDE